MTTIVDDTPPQKPAAPAPPTMIAPRGDLAPADEGPRAFGRLLLEFEDGDLHADLSAEIMGLMKRLGEHAKLRGKAKGELTLSATFAVDEYGVVEVSTAYKVKAPTPPRRKSTMWLTPGNNLSPANPRQVTMDLREVPRPETRDVPVEKRKVRDL